MRRVALLISLCMDILLWFGCASSNVVPDSLEAQPEPVARLLGAIRTYLTGPGMGDKSHCGKTVGLSVKLHWNDFKRLLKCELRLVDGYSGIITIWRHASERCETGFKRIDSIAETALSRVHLLCDF
jgi:hypothetical protein